MNIVQSLQLSIWFTPSRCLDVRQDWYLMYYPEGMKARVSPVQSIEPHRILAPTRDSKFFCTIKNETTTIFWCSYFHSSVSSLHAGEASFLGTGFHLADACGHWFLPCGRCGHVLGRPLQTAPALSILNTFLQTYFFFFYLFFFFL